MFKSLIEYLIHKISGREFKFSPEIPFMYLFEVCIILSVSCIRGIFHGAFLCFIGRDVKIYGRKKIKFGKNIKIGDHSIVDGIGVDGIYFGDNFNIGRFSSIKVSGCLSNLGKGIFFGDNIGIGDYAHIGGAGGVKIGNDCIIGSFFSVHPENHIFLDFKKLIREQGVSRKGVIIGDNCWIGAKVTILDGACVGSGCVIAAGAVVRGVFPDNVVIAGIPAKIIKERINEKKN